MKFIDNFIYDVAIIVYEFLDIRAFCNKLNLKIPDRLFPDDFNPIRVV